MFNEDGHSAEKFHEFFAADYDSPDIRKHIRLCALETLSGRVSAAGHRLAEIERAARREAVSAPRILASPLTWFLRYLMAQKAGETVEAQAALNQCFSAGGRLQACLNDLALLLRDAMELLANTGMPVSQFAFRLGFVDPAYFTRFFKRETGQNPGAFRRSHRRSDTTEPQSFAAWP